MYLSIVLPARNEEQIIKKTLGSIVKYLEKKDYMSEIVVVVNGSTDNTLKICQKVTSSKCKVVIKKSKAGYGYAMKAGLKTARGKYIAIFNVDFYDLNILDLADVGLCGRDMWLGSKQNPWSVDERPTVRKIISRCFNVYLNLIHGFKGTDTHGIKIFKREMCKKVLLATKTTTGIFDTEFVIRAQKMGFKLAEFPVNIREIRPPRFKNRLMQTPKDLYDLYMAINEK